MGALSANIRTPLLIGSIILGVLLIAMVVTGCLILNACKGSPGNFQYMVLLGAKVYDKTPSPILQDRINAAYTYLSQHEDVICIVSGGKASDTRISEAQCMYDQLIAMGIPAQRLWIEDQAINTKQNIRYCLALIEEKTGSRPDTLGVLSSDTHLLRANLLAKRQGVAAVTIPAPSAHRSSFWKHFLREIFIVWYYVLIEI